MGRTMLNWYLTAWPFDPVRRLLLLAVPEGYCSLAVAALRLQSGSLIGADRSSRCLLDILLCRSQITIREQPLTESDVPGACAPVVSTGLHNVRKYAGLSIRRPGFKSCQRAESPGRSTRTTLGQDHHQDRDAAGWKDSPRQATSQNH